MDPSNTNSAANPQEIQPQSSEDDPHSVLGKCLLSQYGITFAAISTSTAYSVYKRPKNGMQIMLLAGATGTLADFIYGWTVACTDQVVKSIEYQKKQDFERAMSSAHRRQ